MFIMVSSSRFQVAPQADGCLGGQLACAAMYYGVFLTMSISQKPIVGVILARRKDFT
jgi:hypothetical protein